MMIDKDLQKQQLHWLVVSSTDLNNSGTILAHKTRPLKELNHNLFFVWEGSTALSNHSPW